MFPGIEIEVVVEPEDLASARQLVLISTPDPETEEGAPVEGSAVVPVMCGNCGYTMLFGPGMLPNQGE